MKKLLQPRKRGTLGQEITASVAQVFVWLGVFAAFRGGLSVISTEPPAATSDLFALFSPTFGAVALLGGPLVAVGCLILRFHVKP